MDLNRTFLPVVRPIRANGNQLHMQSVVGMHSAALIPLEMKLRI